MPSTRGRPRKRTTSTLITEDERREVLEDLQPKPERAKSSTKELPISKVITDTLTDRISATASYAVSGQMVQTVGKDVAITPVEAYNIFYPTTRIIAFYLPGTVIKTSLPAQVADNLEKILITTLEYITRISAGWVKKRFDLQLHNAGITEAVKLNRSQIPDESLHAAKVQAHDDIIEEFDNPIIAQNGQVKPQSSGPLDYEELIATGMVIGDTGQNLS